MIRASSLLALACALSPAALAEEPPAECEGSVGTRLVPLPVFATLPNEGNTWGFMPVFLRVCDPTRRTQSIIAPSVTWNDVIHWTGTLRWFYYPADDRTLTFIASLSTRINSNVLLQWKDLPRRPGAFTTELELRWQRSVFYRFFGLGPKRPRPATRASGCTARRAPGGTSRDPGTPAPRCSCTTTTSRRSACRGCPSAPGCSPASPA